MHLCDNRSCPLPCHLCKRLCSSSNHLHAFETDVHHLCGYVTAPPTSLLFIDDGNGSFRVDKNTLALVHANRREFAELTLHPNRWKLFSQVDTKPFNTQRSESLVHYCCNILILFPVYTRFNIGTYSLIGNVLITLFSSFKTPSVRNTDTCRGSDAFRKSRP